MVELENIRHSTLESNRYSASNRLNCPIACYCEGICRPNRFAGWTIHVLVI